MHEKPAATRTLAEDLKLCSSQYEVIQVMCDHLKPVWPSHTACEDTADAVLTEVWARARRASQEDAAAVFQRGWKAGWDYRGNQMLELGGATIALPGKEQD